MGIPTKRGMYTVALTPEAWQSVLARPEFPTEGYLEVELTPTRVYSSVYVLHGDGALKKLTGGEVCRMAVEADRRQSPLKWPLATVATVEQEEASLTVEWVALPSLFSV